MKKYRAAVDSKNRVLVIAEDAGQKDNYCTIGKWCKFTVGTVPTSTLSEKNPGRYLFKVVKTKIVPRTQKDLDKD